MFGKPLPEAMIAFDGKGIALRDNNGDMVMVPLGRAGGFTKEVWKENFDLRLPDKAEQKLLKKIFSGKEIAQDLLDIKCDNEKNCTYKNVLHFKADGSIYLNNKKIDTKLGAYVYISPEGYYSEPIITPSCRPWNKCF